MSSVPGRSADEADDFDDAPETYLDDDDYDSFLRSEFDADGRVKGDPPVALILVAIVVALLALAVLWLR